MSASSRSEPTLQDRIAGTGAGIPSDRRGLVDKARQTWIRKLIDLSRRNNLLFYRPLKTGTLDLSDADPQRISALLSGEIVPVSKLVPNGHDGSVERIALEIARRALANLEEKGLQTLFVTLGLATWPAEDDGRPPEAPILLLPVAFDLKGHGTHTLYLARSGSIQVNLVLLHVLETQFGLQINPEDLIARLGGDDEAQSFDPAPVYEGLCRHAAAVPGFAVRPCAILGNFAFQKLAMVKDLQERLNELAAHDVIAAIAGDSTARTQVGEAEQDLDPRELDRIPPDNEFIVLDADSSQQCAIAGVIARQNAVIHGPPGTGKSQTIANLIASLAATGGRVLFVAEKRAALDVVKRRLHQVGLGHVAIDLHGADLSPKKVMQQVAQTLDTVRSSTPVECEKIHTQLLDRRTKLCAHVQRLHQEREPTHKSVYQMQGTLLRLGAIVSPTTRWRNAELASLTTDVAEPIRDLLLEAGGFASLFLRSDPSPWTGANLPDGTAVQKALMLVAELRDRVYPAFMEALNAVVRQTRLRWPATIRQTWELTTLLAAVQETFAKYHPELYKHDLDDLLRGLSHGKRGGITTLFALCTKSQFRRARSLGLKLRRHKTSSRQLFNECTEAAQHALRWRSLSIDGDAIPCPVTEYDLHRSCFEALFRNLVQLQSTLRRPHLDELSIDELGALIRGLAGDTSTPYEIPRLMAIEANLEKLGVGSLISEIRKHQPASELWPRMFEYSWFASSLDHAAQQDPEIRGFRGSTHTRYVEDFTRLDEERIAIAADRVRRAHAQRAIEAMNSHRDQEHLIRSEASKSRRHLPLRRVFAQAPEVLTAVCPCWMASPLAVSQLLDGGKQYFDFVIFDEASQVLPEDAVPSILRGKKLVVAGDNKQLPPTTFFAASDEEEYVADEEAGAAEGFESLLDMMMPFVRSRYLDWHYRSRDEALINFSNHYIYQGRLVTFPGPGGPPVIDHVLVPQQLGVDGQEDSSTPEVRRVTDLVLEHARKYPSQTLGVIAMGIRHMNRVQAAIDRELERYPELHDFFNPEQQERFFVKNLERVQGDERDAIIVSIGYGKDRGGNLPLRFGPLLSEGGRRRLNVAITRARQRLTVVSSFSHLDIDLSRVRPGTGVELLRDYLMYAASQGKRLGDAELTTVPLNDFEAEVFDVLSAQGIRLVPQLGASRFRIDMVAEHPHKPGRFVLAIECDGASYHSSYTARDRDRLRQQQLENLGWRFHRIWSTDWFIRKEEEVARAKKAFDEAIAFADKLDSVGTLGSNGTKLRMNGNSHQATTNKRAPRPAISFRPVITQYTPWELAQLINWINSDGQLRTDDEILSEMVAVLGFSRRGARIEAAIRRALQLTRRT